MSFDWCNNKIVALLLMLVLGSNLYLVLMMRNQNKIIVMVPSLERELVVGAHFVSEEYLLLRAEQIMQLLFNIRHENFAYNMTQILRQVSSKHKADFTEQLELFVADVRSKRYFYVFNQDAVEIDNKGLSVMFSGYLETFINNKLVTVAPKRYKLSFVNNSGLVTLVSFEEVHNDKS